MWQVERKYMIAFGTPTHSIVVVSNIRDDAKEKSVENGFWGCNIVCALTGPNHLLWSTSSPESEEEINNSFNLSNSITMDTLCLSTWQWHQVVLVLCSCHRWLSQFSFDAAGTKLYVENLLTLLFCIWNSITQTRRETAPKPLHSHSSETWRRPPSDVCCYRDCFINYKFPSIYLRFSSRLLRPWPNAQWNGKIIILDIFNVELRLYSEEWNGIKTTNIKYTKQRNKELSAHPPVCGVSDGSHEQRKSEISAENLLH